MLNQNQVEGKWNDLKGGIRAIWGRISDQELEELKGNLGEITGIVEDRYGETKDEIKKKLNQLLDSFDNETDKNHLPDRDSFQRRPVEEPISPHHRQHLQGAFRPGSFDQEIEP